MNFAQKLSDKVNQYFNDILKNSLKYDDFFTISIANGDKVILLENENISTISKELSKSELIKMLNVDQNLVKQIENSIQKGLEQFTGLDINKFNIKIIIIDENDFVIQY